MDGKTNIQVTREIKDFLVSHGKKGESYDDILRKLLKTTYDWNNVYKTEIPVQTKNGTEIIDIIVPKLNSIDIDSDEYCDALAKLCKEHNIEIIE